MTTRRRQRGPGDKPAIRMSAVLGLQKIDLFKGLDTASLREIAGQCRWTRCKRNQFVLRRDGADRDVYFVVAGLVRVAAAAGRGRRIIFRDIPAGEAFGEHSAIDGRRSFADVSRSANRCSPRCRRKPFAPSSPSTRPCASACCAA